MARSGREGLYPETIEADVSEEQGSPDLARRYGGLGLGLAISRSLVLAHGGRLTAVSPGQGQGATFTVELPHAFEGEKNNVAGGTEESAGDT